MQNTVGKFTKGKTPEQVAKLKIVDPACGSGSFLIGAYQHLIKWHFNFYKPEFERLSQISGSNEYNGKQRNDAIKERNKLPLTPESALTTTLKKQILLNNIYGVDIDTQAVEVTKLSLLLKCMEGETGSSINAVMRFGERVLPTLENNIKSGNSLIDVDFYDTEFDFGEEKKIKPFNWQNAFSEVFKQGGFDAVIGNPPYVRQEMLGDIKLYLQKKYKVFHGMADLYSYFVEKGIGLLNDKGFFGIIVANKWMRAKYGEPLRKWFKEQSIYQIVDFGDLPVFQNATTYPCIVIAGKNVPRTGLEPMYRFVVDVKTLEFETLAQYINDNKENFQQDKLEDSGWNLGSEAEQKLLMKLNTFGTPLGDYVNGNIYYGIKTGLNEAFVIDEATKSRLIAEDKKSAEIIKPFLGGKNIKRYEVCRSNKFLIFTKRGIQIDNYPAVKTYLLQFKQQLVPKPKDYKGADWKGRKPGAYLWYELQDAIDYFEEFEKTKIVIPDIALQMQGTFDKSNFYLGNTGYIIPSDDKYLLGILNSSVTQFLYSKLSSSIRGGYLRFIRQYLEVLPIKEIDKKSKTEKLLHDEIVKQVETMLELNKQKQTTTLSEKLDQLNQRIAYTDDKINKLVYQLYELTDEEFKIVEGR